MEEKKKFGNIQLVATELDLREVWIKYINSRVVVTETMRMIITQKECSSKRPMSQLCEHPHLMSN